MMENHEDYRFEKSVNLLNSSVTLPLEVYYNWTDVRRTIQVHDTPCTPNTVYSKTKIVYSYILPESFLLP